MSVSQETGGYPAFDRQFLTSDADFTVIGTGQLGGKAKGLGFIKRVLAESCAPGTFPDVDVNIPRLTVIATDVFVEFMERNGLYEIACSDAPDERIAMAFQKAQLPTLILGDLRALVADVRTPLAVRSSSLLEDALSHPFAGTYATKMISNNQADVATRFARLTEAIKFVYASTFFRDARSYRRAIGQPDSAEQMAVIIQEVVGYRFHERFYPAVSGVIRTHNFYPLAPARPEDGVVALALGLGKTIVDGGLTWTYSPAYPQHGPPYGSAHELIRNTQTTFWAVNMGPPPAYDPINEAEYLVQAELADAEYDGVLEFLASTYDAESDRVVVGTGRPGPRVLNFAPLLELETIPLNRIIQHIAGICKEAVGSDVEVEFALTLTPRGRPVPVPGRAPHRFGFLQLRPARAADEQVDLVEEELTSPRTVVATTTALGNGTRDDIVDIVYVKPAAFEGRHTRRIAAELETMNRQLLDAGRPYLLIGFGRWGSSDPWLGIPVTWPQISGARVIVEATLPEMNVEPSQGSHFFHNMTSFRVPYLTVRHTGPYRIQWDWLASLPAVAESEFLRHVRAPAPLQVKVDGRTGRAVVLRGAP
jgi:hypothetical protein